MVIFTVLLYFIVVLLLYKMFSCSESIWFVMSQILGHIGKDFWQAVNKSQGGMSVQLLSVAQERDRAQVSYVNRQFTTLKDDMQLL